MGWRRVSGWVLRRPQKLPNYQAQTLKAWRRPISSAGGRCGGRSADDHHVDGGDGGRGGEHASPDARRAREVNGTVH